VFVRLVLLIVLAVAVVTGAGGSADVQVHDTFGAVAAIADGEMDAQDAALAWIPGPMFFVTPLVLSGTEVAHPSPEMARVFRPPRASFV